MASSRKIYLTYAAVVFTVTAVLLVYAIGLPQHAVITLMAYGRVSYNPKDRYHEGTSVTPADVP